MTIARVVTCLMIVLAGCHRTPKYVYEYEPPVTITSTGPPGGAPGATTTTLPSGGSTWEKGGGR